MYISTGIYYIHIGGAPVKLIVLYTHLVYFDEAQEVQIYTDIKVT